MSQPSWHMKDERGFALWPAFLGHDRHAQLLRWLADVPMREARSHDPRDEFAFVAPIYDGGPITTRIEAAAGTPISIEGQPVGGVALPNPLAELASEVDATLDCLQGDVPSFRRRRPLTSVYVDQYPTRGSFVPHTDRTIYGEVVAGVSLGTGVATLTFSNEELGERRSFQVAPRSLYAFWGELRYAPWRHEAREITGLRYVMTFRSAGGPVSQP